MYRLLSLLVLTGTFFNVAGAALASPSWGS